MARKPSPAQIAKGYTVERHEGVAAYPRNGNFHNPTKRYYWTPKLNGEVLSIESTLKGALEMIDLHEKNPE